MIKKHWKRWALIIIYKNKSFLFFSENIENDDETVTNIFPKTLADSITIDDRMEEQLTSPNSNIGNLFVVFFQLIFFYINIFLLL